MIAQADGRRLVGITDWIGRAVDHHASAFGKLLLSELSPADVARELERHPPRRMATATKVEPAEIMVELERTRERGYALTVDEFEEGLSAVGLPVRDAHGRLIAMLGVGGPSFRVGARRLADCRRVLEAATRRLQRELDEG